MNHKTLRNSTILQFAAAAFLATAPELTASAEEALQFHQPQTFASGLQESLRASAAEANSDITPITRTFDEVEIVRERYPDGKVKVERQVTLDADGNYVNHGAWRLISPTEKVIAEGQFDMGKRVGSWTRWLGRTDSPIFSQFPYNRFKPPYASQAIFNNGELDGEWLITDSDDKKMLQVSLTGGKRNGLVMVFLPNGKPHYQASFDQSVPVGDVMEADKNGELKRVATYIDGRRLITKSANYKRTSRSRKAEEPKKSEEMFLAATTVETTPDNFWNAHIAEYTQQGNDLRHGPSKTWFENGQLQVEGNYQNDKRSGGFTYYYANGQIAATGEYQDDLPADVWVWWHENGQKAAVGKYASGALVDEWRWWDESGKLAQKQLQDGTQFASTDPQEMLKTGRAPEHPEVATRPTDEVKVR